MVGAPPLRRVRPLRIFVVENHAGVLQCLCRYLQSMGHTVVSARSMAEALRTLPTSDCEVLISDVGLPDGDAWDLLRYARLPRPIYAVTIGGLGTAAPDVKSKAAGFRRHLPKPLALDELELVLACADREAAVLP